MQPIKLAVLEAVFDHMKGRVTYDFGGKAPSLTCDTSEIDGIDCSGFVRYALAKASDQKFILPDGSSNQRDRCNQIGLHKLASYSDVQYGAKDPNRLFIAFIAAHGGHPGHVWLVRGGVTMESHGGAGVSSREWDVPVLKSSACAAYELATE